MKVVFRADASTNIGTGHIIRCLTLAHVLRQRGAKCSFVQRLHRGNLVQIVAQQGFRSIALPAPLINQPSADEDYDAWLGVSQSIDAEQCLEYLATIQPDVLIIDHYGLDAEWELKVRDQVGQIVVIDDLANRPHDGSLLLDQNYYRAGTERYRPLLSSNARVLAGPRYALLSDRYRRHRPSRPPDHQRVEQILIYYGGVDPDNETARALRVLSGETFSHLRLDVIVGINNPNADEVARLARNRPNTHLYGQQDDLVDHMLAADLTLGAGGTTTWERACLGLPSVVTTTAANQVPYNRELAEDGLIFYAGHTSELRDQDLVDKLLEAISPDSSLTKIARRSWKLVDGLGAHRVAEQIMPTPAEMLTIRDATSHDIDHFFGWANEPENRHNSFNQDPIPWPDHQSWFDRRLDADDAWLWVLCADSQLPVGEAHIERTRGMALLSYTVDADYRGRGWGRRFLQMIGQRWRQISDSEPLFAETKITNTASIACFEACGCFQQISESATHNTYQLK